ncbi:type VI-B CRISPR-associated RNA-guided ribonuclease Cas13b [Wenyingzhuangia sp. IMCC45574]
MEKTTSYFAFDSIEDKHFFASILNTAIDNFVLALKELNHRTFVFKKEVTEDNSITFIQKCFDNQVILSDWDYRVKTLAESLPFLEVWYAKNGHQPIELTSLLCMLYRTLKMFRNYYTHYHHDLPVFENNGTSFFQFLDEVLLQSARSIKKDRCKHPDYLAYLRTKYNTHFQETIDAYNLRIEEFNAHKNPKEKKRFTLKPNEEDNYVINQLFKTFLWQEDDKVLLNTRVASKKENSQENNLHALSTYGFLQFMSLFLNKKQQTMLLNYTQYFKDTREIQFQVTRWVFCHFCYKDSKKLYKSSFYQDAFLLQMVSELEKCPKELYNYLPQEQKQEFIKDINTYISEKEEVVSHEVIQKRYQDAFPYFAIRFLDEFINFPNLRFQIQVGSYEHDSREKKDLGNTTTRVIKEQITVFEKLSTVLKYKNDFFDKQEGDQRIMENWHKFPNPKYQFNQNNIGICIKNNTIKPSPRLNGKTNKEDILKKLGLPLNILQKPEAYLSFNELPALLHAILVEKKTPREIESLILKRIGIISSGKNPKFKTKKARLTEKETPVYLDDKKLKRVIIFEIQDINPLKTIRDRYTKLNENTFLSNSEKGKIATWLVNDIKSFVRLETRKDWKSHQVSEWQSLLAFYNDNKFRLKEFMQNVLEIDLDKDNPFKGIDFKQKNLHSFYTNYLEKRCIYLQNIIDKTLPTLTAWESSLNFLPKRKFVISKEEYEQNLKNSPVNLGRGVFDDKPTYSTSQESMATWFTESQENKEIQEYYHYPRVYEYEIEKKVYNKYKNRYVNKTFQKSQKIHTKLGIKEQLNKDITKICKKLVYDNEKVIRKNKRNDYYTLEMIKFLLNRLNLNEGLEHINLKDTFINREERDRIEENSRLQSIREKGNTTQVIVNDSHLLSKRIPISMYEGKLTGKVALKEISKYRKLANDVKANILVNNLYKGTPLKISEITYELDQYNIIRAKEFFKAVHDFENKTYNKALAIGAEALEKLKRNGIHKFTEYVSYAFFRENESQYIDFLQCVINNNYTNEAYTIPMLIIEIRNKISHNELPTIKNLKKLEAYVTKEEEEDTVISYVLKAFKEGTKP